jgi:hypothetical protein
VRQQPPFRLFQASTFAIINQAIDTVVNCTARRVRPAARSRWDSTHNMTSQMLLLAVADYGVPFVKHHTHTAHLPGQQHVPCVTSHTTRVKYCAGKCFTAVCGVHSYISHCQTCHMILTVLLSGCVRRSVPPHVCTSVGA